MVTRNFEDAPRTTPLYVKAALPALPVVGGLPGVRHASSGGLPDEHVARTGIVTSTDELASYNSVCGYSLRASLPPTYPHLAAFGLQLALMTETSFPFAPMGLVHLTNSITHHRPIAVNEPYDLTVHAQNVRDHPRGRLVDLISRASVGGAVAWEETSSYLSRGTRSDTAADSPLEGVDAPDGTTRWRLGGDLGRRYAAVSGDRNPIHLYRLTAKAFGFPRQIAHGMWTKARCLAALEGRLPAAYRVDVEFKKPILLPGTVRFGAEIDGRTDITFGVTGTKNPATHLIGRVDAL